jgi:predicted nucleotide-binding protein
LPEGGRTVIENLEAVGASTAFAVVLLTDDDLGGPAGTEELQPRARQNVTFELGLFIAP